MNTVVGANFSESFVEADGFRIRYREAGRGEPLVCLHGGGGLRLSGTHELLSRHHRVIAFEVPGFGKSPENTRSASMDELAATMNAAVSALNLERYSLLGISFGGKLALAMAMAKPEPVASIVLLGPAAIRLEGGAPPPTRVSPEEALKLLYAHPERIGPQEPMAPEVAAKNRKISERLVGPPREAEFEKRLAGLQMPVLALFGTLDRVIPPEVAHLYREVLPNCHIIMVYDAAHAIDADRPEAASAVIDDFLTRQDKFLVRNTSGLLYR
jgi:pimeloyl-ACP methyl ester carboxylesterase